MDNEDVKMFEQKVYSFIKKHNLLAKDDTVIVGVSGGPDSLALLHYLYKHQEQYQIRLICAHVDHMFRGEESYQDLLYVQSVCESWGILFEGKRMDVTQYQTAEQLSPQKAARDCRYAFFDEIMKKHQATKLALAHHGDDQVETILMSLTRGSTMKGRSGIPFKRSFSSGEIVRPFLSVEKNEIEAYCLENNLEPKRDPTNEKLDYTRNRFRRKVLPFLKKENQEVAKQFQRFSEELTEDEAYLEVLSEQYLNKVVNKKNEGLYKVTIKKYLQIPQPLQRRGIHLILKYLYKDLPSSLSAVHIEQILHLFKSHHPSGTLCLPKKLYVFRSYDEGIFQFGNEETKSYEYQVNLGEAISLPNGGTLTLEEVRQATELSQESEHQFYLAKDTVFPLVVRTRKNGDRVKPFGLDGHKKIKDLFIDEKIPLSKRNTWPIVTDGLGNILWIPGLKKSCFEAKSSKEALYILRYR